MVIGLWQYGTSNNGCPVAPEGRQICNCNQVLQKRQQGVVLLGVREREREKKTLTMSSAKFNFYIEQDLNNYFMAKVSHWFLCVE